MLIFRPYIYLRKYFLPWCQFIKLAFNFIHPSFLTPSSQISVSFLSKIKSCFPFDETTVIGMCHGSHARSPFLNFSENFLRLHNYFFDEMSAYAQSDFWYGENIVSVFHRNVTNIWKQTVLFIYENPFLCFGKFGLR